MKIHQLKIMLSLFIFTLCLSNSVYADKHSSIKFFISNNTREIGIEKAYERMTHQPQHELMNNTVDLLQKDHVEQGRFEHVLGIYQMNSDKNITSDNTEILCTSPYQVFPHNQIFSLAQQFASTFQQESIAVFVPSHHAASFDVAVEFTSNQPSITTVIQLIQSKLPAYANAFSLHLISNNMNFNDAKVSEVEWLGSKININAIKKVFPQDDISYSRGQAYLIYQNGQIVSI